MVFFLEKRIILRYSIIDNETLALLLVLGDENIFTKANSPIYIPLSNAFFSITFYWYFN